MEGHIVKEFQNLRVFSKSKLVRMDELVQDLASALEESARTKTPSSKRSSKKRKGKKRRTYIIEGGNISEASESSIEEALKDYIENVAQQSDSDDINISQRITRLTMPLSSNYVPSVESDSVTETFSPIRPQRRRKKYKAMTVDAVTDELQDASEPDESEILQGKYNSSTSTMQVDMASPSTSHSNMSSVYIFPGKRKRNSKSRTDFLSGDLGASDMHSVGDVTMEMGSQESNSSSSLSSSESDGLITNDEGREGDDEQSDFYFENGSTCGIPGIIPWWEKDQDGSEESASKEKEFQQILTGTFEHMSKSSQLAFKARLTRLMAKSGREIRFGRRKVKEKRPGYTVSRFLQDRKVWNSMQGLGALPPPWQSSASSSLCNDSKRIRKTPPPILPQEGFIGGEAEPISENNMGSKILQGMGWTPGTGLGADGSGIKTPVLAYRRPRRQGLGCSGSQSRHQDLS